MSTPTVREYLSGWSETADITLTTGSGTLSTSWLVVGHGSDYYTDADLNAPSGTGWTLVGGEGNTSSGHPHIKVWTKTATGGAQAVVLDQPIDAGHHGHLYVLDGVTSIEDVAGFFDVATTDHVLGALDTTANDDLIVGFAIGLSPGGAGSYDYTAPSGLPKRGETDRPPYSTMAAFDGTSSTLGTNGPWTASASAAREYATVSIVVKGVPSPPISTGGADVTVAVGAATVGVGVNPGSGAVGVTAPFDPTVGLSLELAADLPVDVAVTAYNPTVSTAANLVVAPGTAAVTVAAADSLSAVAVLPPAATVAVTGGDAAVVGVQSLVAQPGTAMVGVTAYNASGTWGGHQVGLPSDLQSVLVIGTYVDSNGVPLAGTIELLPSVDLVSSGTHTAVRRVPIIGKLDVDGVLRAADGVAPLLIPATDDPDITPTGWTYTVTEKLGAASKPAFNLSAPLGGGDIDLPSASPSVPPSVPGGVAVTKINAKSPNGSGQVTLVPGDIGAAATVHTHAIADVTGLQSALDGKETAGAAATALAGHTAAADPHPQYLTPAEASSAYATTTHTHNATAVTELPFTREFSVSGDLDLLTGGFSWYNDFGRAINIVAMRVTVGTSPTGAPVTVELRKNGAAFTSAVTASIAPTGSTAKVSPAGASLADGDRLTANITSVGSATRGADLVVQVTMVIV